MLKTNVQVKLSGEDGNAMLIIGRVRKALIVTGHAQLAQEFAQEAVKGDYDHVLQTCMEYVEVC